MKLDPDELRQIGAELEAVKLGHPDLLKREPDIAKHLDAAQETAMQKYEEVAEQ